MVEIKIKGADKLIKNFKNSEKIISKELRLGMAKASLFTSKQVKLNLRRGPTRAIDTGALRRGIHVETSLSRFYKGGAGETISIQPSPMTPYAKYVHDGTWKMKKRPYFDYTVEKDAEKIQRFFDKVVDNIIISMFK